MIQPSLHKKSGKNAEKPGYLRERPSEMCAMKAPICDGGSRCAERTKCFVLFVSFASWAVG